MTNMNQETNKLVKQINTNHGGGLWQVGRLVIENNIIESSLDRFIDAIPDPRAGTVAFEIFAGANNTVGYPCVFQQVVVRRNIIGHVDNSVGNAPPYYHFGIYLNGCLSAIVENNVINVVTPIEQVIAGTLKYFKNQSSAGNLIQGHDYTASHYVNELTDAVNLALSKSI